jgi:16S rRNA (adenine1518-N6/adenine1519-N6)-dimethyltransferase
MIEPAINLPPLREIIARHRLAASKALGQNFLLDEQLLDKIAAIPGSMDKMYMKLGRGRAG